MNLELIEVMRQIERSRKVDRSVLIEAIEAALISASRKNFGAAQDIRVSFNEDTGDLVAYVRKTVVEEVSEPRHQIAVEEAKRLNPDVNEGDVIEQAISPSDFGRIAAQTAKQVVLQRVRESERNAYYEEYKQRVGELINGSVIRQENRNVIIDLGETEAILPAREQVSKEFFQSGDRVKAYILDVRRSNRAPQVILSRSHPGLIRRLFEMEVPEVSDGVVEIKGVAREAGSRSKVMVYSEDKNVDPVGACVGIKGSRIQAIVREIRGEKIDVIPFSEEAGNMLKAALQPAKIISVERTLETKKATVIVKDDQLSLAIGKNGQNVRLASKLTGWKIDILSDVQNQEMMRKKAEEAFMKTAPPLDKIKGISAKLATTLKESGFEMVSDFAEASVESLSQLPGIGAKTAEKILFAVEAYLPKAAEVKVERTADELFAGLGESTGPITQKEKIVAASELFAALDQVEGNIEDEQEDQVNKEEQSAHEKTDVGVTEEKPEQKDVDDGDEGPESREAGDDV